MKAKDLAKKLGVSPATISLVLNNKPGISDSLRHSLLEKIQELGCGDMLCSSYPQTEEQEDLTLSKTRPVIAYLIYTSSDERDNLFAFFPAVLEGAEMEARDNNITLTVLHMNCEGNANLNRLIECSGNVIGVIVQTYNITDCILQDLRTLNVPYVFVDAYRPDVKASSVCVNNEQGILSAVKYLKEKGHQNIGYVYSGCGNDSQIERRRFFHQALRELELEDRRENYFIAGCASETADFDILRELFQNVSQMPTALMAENDRLAWRTMKALQQNGYRVPEDVSVIGFDDRSICTMVEPNLTSVKNYRHLMGRQCVLLLKNIVRLRKLGIKNPCLKCEIPTDLIERDSVRDLTKS